MLNSHSQIEAIDKLSLSNNWPLTFTVILAWVQGDAGYLISRWGICLYNTWSMLYKVPFKSFRRQFDLLLNMCSVIFQKDSRPVYKNKATDWFKLGKKRIACFVSNQCITEWLLLLLTKGFMWSCFYCSHYLGRKLPFCLLQGHFGCPDSEDVPEDVDAADHNHCPPLTALIRWDIWKLEQNWWEFCLFVLDERLI